MALSDFPPAGISTPLVSCIMPTCNRRRFIPQALRCFARRTYRNAELILVDDSDRSVRSLCEGLEDVRYIRVNGMRTGAKLNLGMRPRAETFCTNWTTTITTLRNSSRLRSNIF